MTRRIIRTTTTAMAIVALAAPTALARPADMPPAVAAKQQEQDMRSPDAIDAATQQNRQDLRAPDNVEYPTRPAGEQANSRPETLPQAPADRGSAWTTIGLVAAAYLLALAAIAGVVRGKRRDGRPRITA